MFPTKICQVTCLDSKLRNNKKKLSISLFFQTGFKTQFFTFWFPDTSVSNIVIIDRQFFFENRFPERRMNCPNIKPNRSILLCDKFVLNVVSDARVGASVAPQSTHSEKKKKEGMMRSSSAPREYRSIRRYRVDSKPNWPERINR